jgi:hypothetical protein
MHQWPYQGEPVARLRAHGHEQPQRADQPECGGDPSIDGERLQIAAIITSWPL